jgi:peptidyl-dipeptidase A
MKMVRTGESFFTSLGFASLPDTFWQRSMFTKPRDREVVCHASAWDIDWLDDLRLKMCIEVKAEDFVTVHHELGHNFYQRAYSGQAPLFRDSANDGFHEAVGDTLALSITPPYLKQLGLIERADPSGDIGFSQPGPRQGRVPAVRAAGGSMALEGVLGKSLPRGTTTHGGSCAAVPGVVAPYRSEADSTRAKYHVAANVPTRGTPRDDPAVPVPPSALPGAGYQGRSIAARSTPTRRRAGA